MSVQRQRGTSFESSLVPLLQRYYPSAHRLGAQGVNDKGDFFIPDPRLIIEAKNYSNYAGHLAGWMGEAEREAKNAGVPWGVVCFKRRGITAPARQYVLTTLGAFLELIA